MSLKNILRNVDRKRRQLMGGLEPLAYRLLSNNANLETALIPQNEVKKIIIVRNNKRIGNMYFLLPFIHEVRAQYPNAQIDLMLNQEWQGHVFENMGINKVHYSHFSFNTLKACLNSLKEVKQETYDLLLAPYSSAGDTIVSSQISARNKVTRYNQKRLAVFPHSPKISQDHRHMALAPLCIFKGLGFQLSQQWDHRMSLTEQELTQGSDAAKSLKEEGVINVAYFRGARGKKLLSAKTWESVLTNYENTSQAQVNWVEILSPDIKEPLREGIQTFQTNNMRHLAAVLTQFDRFICCDTGPLHLADAADVKCLGLYNETDPESFGLLSKHSYHIECDIEDESQLKSQLSAV
ncbi:MAG: glycosyltransferase family 9 protein [Vibrio gallaecicus]